MKKLALITFICCLSSVLLAQKQTKPIKSGTQINQKKDLPNKRITTTTKNGTIQLQKPQVANKEVKDSVQIGTGATAVNIPVDFTNFLLYR